MSNFRLAAPFVVFAAGLCAQQPNTSQARFMIDMNDGPVYPMQINVRTNTQTVFTLQGLPYMPYSVCASPDGNLHPDVAMFFGDKWDLTLPTNYSTYLNTGVIFDGIAKYPSVFNTTAIGTGSITINVPPPGSNFTANSIPLGTVLAFQTIMTDPTSSYGFSLTAATKVTITQGPTVTSLSVGDEGIATMTLPFTVPFYGSAYSTLYIYANGYVHFGTQGPSDYTPSPSQFVAQPPRMAGYWTDLDQSTGTVITTVDSNPPGATPYFQVDYAGVIDYTGIGYTHTFSMYIDTTGMVKLISAINNNPSIFDIYVGIGPGNNLNPNGINFTGKNLSALVGSYYAGVQNENFWEWFGIPGVNPNYGGSSPNPYDLIGVTNTWFPNGTSGLLPGSSDTYVAY